MQLIIDHREGKLKELCNQHNVPATFENLTHADIQVVMDSKPVLLFERKTIADLVASITDGRYRNQKISLLNEYGKDQVYYIIEGPMTYSLTPLKSSDKAVQGAIINTLLRDKIGIFFTKNVDETFQLIQNVWHRVQEDPSKYLPDSQLETSACKLQPQLQHNRVGDMTACYRMQLCQVPDVSVKTADAIMAKFPTMVQLVQTMTGKSKEEKLNLLKDIVTTDSKGKQRKLSSRVVDNIINYIFGNEHGG